MSEKYVEMWKNIGMDIEKHNILLNALGQFYSSIYLSQKNRPKKMDYFDFVVSEIHGLRIKELNDQRAKGKKVIGAFCIYAPEELAYAADAINGWFMRRRRLLCTRRRSSFATKPLPTNQIILRLQTQPNLPILPIKRPRRGRNHL